MNRDPCHERLYRGAMVCIYRENEIFIEYHDIFTQFRPDADTYDSQEVHI
jgi:hypothetical protein